MYSSSAIFEDNSFCAFSYQNKILDDCFSRQILKDILKQNWNYKKAKGGKLWVDLREAKTERKCVIDSFKYLNTVACSEEFLCNLSQSWSTSHSSLRQGIAEKYGIEPEEVVGKFPYESESSQLRLITYKEIKNSSQKSIFHKINDFPLRSRIQISKMPEKSVILPHTDLSSKIASIMLYLPTSLRQKDSLLGTTFWKKRSNVTVKQKETSYLSGIEYLKFSKLYGKCRTPFKGSSLIYFFRSDHSWHSFEHDCIGIGERISVNINFMLTSN